MPAMLEGDRVFQVGPGSAPSAGTAFRPCVLVATRNEAGTVVPLLARLSPVLAPLGGEVLFVEDSDDGTPYVVAAAGRTVAVPVRLLHRRPGERVGGMGGEIQAVLRAATTSRAARMRTPGR